MKENKSIGEVHHPGVGMVRWKTRKDLSGSLMIAEGIVEILSVAQILKKIGERYSIRNVKTAHSLLPQTN